MTPELAIVLLLLAVAVGMFVAGRPRMDVVALIMIAVLPLSGTVMASEALAGFSDSNVVLIAALFVIGEGLVRTGHRPQGIASPICHDSGSWFPNGIHDADIIAGDHACCWTGRLHLRGLRAHRYAADADRARPQRAVDVMAVAAAITGPSIRA
jgi:hypothetical protein